MFFAAVPLAASFWLLFSLPPGMTGIVAFLAILGAYLLFDTFHTMISMAYYAMTPEMTMDYNERTSITTVRMVFSAIGYIFGAAATTFIANMLRDSAGWTQASSWSAVGILYGVLAMIVVLITSLTVRKKPVVSEEPTKMPPISAIVSTFKNKPFIKLVVITGIAATSFALITSLLPYYLIYQLKMENELSIVMLLMLVTLGLSLWPSKKLSERIGKGPAFGVGMAIATVAMALTFFLPDEPTPLIYVVAVFAGMGFASQWVFPWSMVPDVIELDEKMTGERREGVYFGIFVMVGKVTGALGIALSGWSLNWFGYMEGAQQTANALLGIRIFFGLLPAAILIVIIPMLLKYPITRKNHEELVRELRDRSDVSS
jgi:GPH family glycoside/pentoside/hexuronide:cation symporter